MEFTWAILPICITFSTQPIKPSTQTNVPCKARLLDFSWFHGGAAAALLQCCHSGPVERLAAGGGSGERSAPHWLRWKWPPFSCIGQLKLLDEYRSPLDGRHARTYRQSLCWVTAALLMPFPNPARLSVTSSTRCITQDSHETFWFCFLSAKLKQPHWPKMLVVDRLGHPNDHPCAVLFKSSSQQHHHDRCHEGSVEGSLLRPASTPHAGLDAAISLEFFGAWDVPPKSSKTCGGSCRILQWSQEDRKHWKISPGAKEQGVNLRHLNFGDHLVIL